MADTKFCWEKTQKIFKREPYGQIIFSEFLHFRVLADLHAPYSI
jgi:hypothetical protein